MYPTVMEDTNGNQITVTYIPGAGPYSTGTGGNPPNTSARINQIFDARSPATVIRQASVVHLHLQFSVHHQPHYGHQQYFGDGGELHLYGERQRRAVFSVHRTPWPAAPRERIAALPSPLPRSPAPASI